MLIHTRKCRYRAVLRVGRPYYNNNMGENFAGIFTTKICGLALYLYDGDVARLLSGKMSNCPEPMSLYRAGTRDEKNLFTTRQISSV